MDFICQQKDFFKNPNKLPLNELQLETQTCKKLGKVPKDKDLEKLKDSLAKIYNVKTEKIPALDPHWIQKDRSYHKYQPYYSELTQDENDLFIQRNKLFLSDLKFLLRCTYHQFWNYLVFEPRIGLILDSFLMNPVPLYEIKYLQGEFMALYTDIYEHVAQLFLRMLNFKESETEFMSEVVTLKYLEDSSLMTFPKILSLCSLYNKMCQNLVNKLADNFFSKLKFAAREMRNVLEHTLLIFEMVGGQVCGFEDDAVVIPIAIRPKPKRFDPYWVEEVVTYLLDTAATLNGLLSNCKAAVDVGLKMGIPYRLTFFYNKVYPALYELLQDRADLPYSWTELKARIHHHIGLGRREFVNVFHIFASDLIDKVIQTLGDNEKQDSFLECYLKMITSSLDDEFFIFNYHNTHHVDVQILTISDFYPNLDRTRSNYILECLSTIPNLQKVLSEHQNSKESAQNEMLAAASTSKEYNGLVDGTTMKNIQPTPSEIEERVQSVLDALPHLGDGFILKCLEAFNYNATEVISAILDERLPSYLDDYPRDLIRIPPEPEPEQPILAYRGKKPTYKDAIHLLNDKSEMQGIKEFISKISSQDIYDDEYDDRDEQDSTLRFYDRNDEVSVYKHMGNRFEGYELVTDPSESSEDEEEDGRSTLENVDKRKGAFCEDPAAVRARYENAKRKPSSKAKGANVVGKPKGQGQDASVTRSRDKKTVNKSSRANHNRKSGAQWKRNKGMMPF